MKKLFTLLMILSLPVAMMGQTPVFYLTFDHMDDGNFEVYDNMNELVGEASGEISTGQYGDGYYLNGTDSYIHFEDNVINRSSFTLTVWFSPEAGPEEPALFQTDGSEMEGGAVFILMYTGDGMECFANGLDAENAFWVEEAPEADSWMHLAMVVDVDAGTATFYANGISVGEFEAEWPGEDDKPLIGPFAIGAHNNDGSYDRFWAGTVDEFRLYDVALTAEEVEATMDEYEGLAVNEIRNQSFAIFPNPTADRIALNQDFELVSVIGITGQEIITLSDYRANREINLENLANGFYFVRAIDNGQEYTRKLIVK